MKYGAEPEENRGSPYGGGTWKNPYLRDGEVVKRYPPARRAARLATCMRVLGHPLSIMMEWAEVVGAPPALAPIETAAQAEAVGIQPAPDKAKSMAEQRAVAAHRAALEKSIEKLAARRTIVKDELDELESELKSLLAMLKAAGGSPVEAAEEPKGKRSAKGKKAKSTKKLTAAKASGPSAVALNLASKGTVTPDLLADETGQTNVQASNVLGRLARDGLLKRTGRGEYGAA